jgi:surface antigen/LysM repeat protein
MMSIKEFYIRSQLPANLTESSLVKSANSVSVDLQRKVKRSFFRSKKRVVRYGLLASNLILVSVIAGFIIASRNNTPTSSSAPILSLSQEEEMTDPLDEISGADIAVNVAELVRMEQATAVRNNADTVNLQLDVVPNDSQVVAKPQIVQTALKSIKDMQEYTTVDGDTVDGVAAKFSITADSVRWSNGLTGNTVAAGTALKIPPVNGVVYEVRDGDTAEKIAQKYSADAGVIIAFNDAEIRGFVPGEKIVVPDGKVQAPVVVRAASYSGFRWGGNTPVYGYNGYDYGYCTWYAANRRAELGKPVPANLGNASTWKVLSQRAGIPVGNTPQAGAVIWTPPRDYYGHVGIVESVNEDGSVVISEMNTVGWGVRSSKTLSAEQAANYSYIY